MRRDGCDSRSLLIHIEYQEVTTWRERTIRDEYYPPFKKLCQRKNKEIFDSPNQHSDDRFQQLFFMWLQKDKVCLHWDKKQFKFLGWQGWRLGVWTEVNSQREILFYVFREKGLHRSRSLTPPQPPHRLPVLCYASCLEKVGWPGTSQTRFSNSFT